MANENIKAEETTKKIFVFKGKKLEELQALEVREFAKYLKSRILSQLLVVRGTDRVLPILLRCVSVFYQNLNVKGLMKLFPGKFGN